MQGGVTWCPQWWKHAEAISRGHRFLHI
ncbi:DUF4913 domain-containing protein [Pseudarthrobacter sp. L1SW]|nr:DUF4913 domain-containing protein [Pseudarthrobacter sp. L1SW]